ncbi:MAG: protein kinase domain-containing protein, partial [Gemmatimonadales bacterium]
LDYAHRHGVIHRDIKPENILLHDGSALVADFGIALAVSTAGGGRLTETGMSLGTPHYMSPEQAMGEREITAKSDEYALACVLYEMLSGEPPFTGPTAQAIVARVMTEEPRSLTMQRKSIPPHVEAAIGRALAKLPADRFGSLAQFAEALTHPGLAGATPMGTRAFPSARSPFRWSALVPWAVAGVTLAAALWGWLRPGTKPSVRPIARFDIQLPRDAQAVGATGSTIAFSPDGSQIVYIGKAPSGQRLYGRRLDRPDPVPIPDTDGALLPFFSADGLWLGFKQGDKLVKVAVAGGPVSQITKVAGEVYGATWTRGDTVIFATDSGLMDVPAAGGSPRLIAKPDSGEAFRFPEALPDGRAVLFGVVGGGTLKLGALVRSSGKVKRLQQQGGYPRFVTGGFVVLNDPTGSVSVVPFDAKRLEVTGAALPFTDKLSASQDGDMNLGVSRVGDFAFQSSGGAGARLVLVDRGGNARDAGADTGYYSQPRISPDGKRVALARAPEAAGNTADIWVFDLLQRTRTRVTFDSAVAGPVWSPDGRRLVFSRFPPGFGGNNAQIFWVPTDGSGTPESLVVKPGTWVGTSFEPDGRGLAYTGGTTQGKWGIWRLRLDGSEPRPLLANSFSNRDASLSPDGRWFVYASNESGRYEIYVRPYPGPGGRWQVSLEGGREPAWSPTGREIFYRDGDQMLAAAVRTQGGGGFEVGNRVALFTGAFNTSPGLSRNYDVSRNGQTFFMLQPLVGTAQDLVVTLNWFDGVRAKRKE